MIKFWHGTLAQYNAVQNKDANTLYCVTDKGGIYKGAVKIAELTADAVADIMAILGTISNTGYATVEAGLTALKDAIAKLNGTTDPTAVDVKVKAAKDAIVGTAADTSADLTLNGLVKKIEEAVTASEVDVEKDADGNYIVKQNGTQVGAKIVIPKDMVVTAGRVVKDPDASHVGTFIELTIANATQDKLYVDVASLIDNYVAKGGATEVQVAIDATTREVSATLVNGGVSTAKLANDAVTTVKIADGNVTTAKIADKNITNDKLADGTISLDKIDSDFVALLSWQTA